MLTMQLYIINMQFTEDKKKDIERDIVELVIAALENKAITTGDTTVIGQMVLQRIDNIENQEDLILFLEVLTERYHIFSPLVLREKGVVEGKREERIIDDVQGLIQNGNIDEALKIVKSATST